MPSHNNILTPGRLLSTIGAQLEAGNNLYFPERRAEGVNESNQVVGDPLFVDAAAGNFQLLGNSPAIDAGDPEAVSWTFEGSAPDIGAFEFGGGSTSPPDPVPDPVPDPIPDPVPDPTPAPADTVLFENVDVLIIEGAQRVKIIRRKNEKDN